MMEYPTIEDVEQADRLQLAKWYRHLPSPGFQMREISLIAINRQPDSEKKIMARIVERFEEFGGFTPEISKAVG